MKLPKKISPDRLKDAIVEVRYNSSLPYEIIIGVIHQALSNDYKYTSRPLPNTSLPAEISDTIPKDIVISFGVSNLFYNDKIKLALQPNSLIFSCFGNYISWENYMPEIEKVLTLIEKTKCFEAFNRIGIRYISEYPEIDLKQCVKFEFSFGMPEVTSNSYTFFSEFQLDGHKVNLNLSNKILTIFQKENQAQIAPISKIDIDVIIDKLNENELKALFEKIETAHLIEKKVFFNLIKLEFLETLNPEY